MRVTQMIDENTFSTKSLIHLTVRAIFYSETLLSAYLSNLALFINNKKNKLF